MNKSHTGLSINSNVGIPVKSTADAYCHMNHASCKTL